MVNLTRLRYLLGGAIERHATVPDGHLIPLLDECLRHVQVEAVGPLESRIRALARELDRDRHAYVPAKNGHCRAWRCRRTEKAKVHRTSAAVLGEYVEPTTPAGKATS